MPSVGDVNVRLTASTAQFTSALTLAQKKIAAVGASMTAVGTRMSAALSLPLAFVGVSALRTAGEFQASMNRVRALTGATANDFGVLKEQALELGRTTVFTAKDAAAAMGFLSQAGNTAAEIFASMPDTLKLAASASLDLATSADIVTNIMKGFGQTTDELGESVDVLVTAFTSANTNLPQLAQALKLVGPVAKGAGLSFKETTAALALMGNAGLQASLAGTGLRQIINKLVNPSRDAEKALDKLGVVAVTDTGAIKDLVSILKEFEVAVAGAGGSANTAADIFSIFGVRAGPSMQVLLSQGSGALEDLIQKFEESGGIAKKISDIQMEGYRGALKRLQSATEGLSISMGQSLIPIFEKFSAGAVNILRRLTLMDTATRNLVLAVAALAIVLGPALIGLGLIIKFVSPMVLLGTAAGILAAAGLLIAANWEEVGPAVEKVGEAVKTLAANKLESIIRDWISEEDLQMMDKFERHLSKFIDDLMNAPWEALKQLGSDTWDEIADAFARMGRDILKEFPVIESTIKFLGEWFEWLKDQASAMLDAISIGWDQLTLNISKSVDAIIDALEAVGTAYTKISNTVKEGIGQTGLNIFGSEDISETPKALQETQKAMEDIAAAGRTLGSLDVFGRGASFADERNNSGPSTPSVEFPIRNATEFEAVLERITTDLQGIKELDAIISSFDLTKLDVQAMSPGDFQAIISQWRDLSAAVEAVVRHMGDGMNQETKTALDKMVNKFIAFQNIVVTNSIIPDTAAAINKEWKSGLATMEGTTEISLRKNIERFTLFSKNMKLELNKGKAEEGFKFFDFIDYELATADIDPALKASLLNLVAKIKEVFGGLGEEISKFIPLKMLKEQLAELEAGMIATANSIKPLITIWTEYYAAVNRINASNIALGGFYDDLPDKIAATTNALVAFQLAFDQDLGSDKGLSEEQIKKRVATIESFQEQLNKLKDTEALEDAFIGLGQTLNSSLTEMVSGVLRGTQTMKEAFRNMVQNILLALANKALTNAITAIFAKVAEAATQSFGGSGFGAIFSGMFGSGKGGSTAGGVLGLALNAGVSGALGGAGGGGAGSPPPLHLASGGPLDAGQLSMVGERGPELFMPKTAGTIIPNHALMNREPKVEINIINKSSAQITNSESRDGMRRRIDIMVVDAIQRDLAQGGKGSQAIGQTFGLNRSGVRR